MMKAKILSRIQGLEDQKTDLELEHAVKEMEEWYEERKRIYNSPEQVELRRKSYEQMLAEGNARRERMQGDGFKY